MIGRDLVGSTIAGRYKVLRKLGSGGMGAVWLVQHLESLQHYALKTLHPHVANDPMSLERFLREARAAAALRSKHVVKVTDAQTTYVDPKTGELTPFIVMELLEGSTLEQIIAKRGAMPSPEVVWVLRQVCRALEVAHQKGIVHRDLKPENVFVALDEDGEPVAKVCDFGIAKLVADSGLVGQNALGTQTGATVGTPLYMSPEQAWNSSTVGVQSDQWAIGLMAFKALTGTDYFGHAKSTAELVLLIVEREMTRPSKLVQLPEAFDAWFLRSCNRDARQRFASTAEQAQALADALGVTRPVPPPLAGATPVVSQPTRDELSTPATVPALPGTPPIATQVAVSPMTPAGTARTADQPSGLGPSPAKRSRAWLAMLSLLSVIVVGGAVAAGIALSRSPTPEHSPSKKAKVQAGTEEPAPEKTENEPPSASTKASISAPSSASSLSGVKPTVSTPLAAKTAPGPTTPKPSPGASSGASASVKPTTPSGKLPKGAPCARSSECASGFCVAEECQ